MSYVPVPRRKNLRTRGGLCLVGSLDWVLLQGCSRLQVMKPAGSGTTASSARRTSDSREFWIEDGKTPGQLHCWECAWNYVCRTENI